MVLFWKLTSRDRRSLQRAPVWITRNAWASIKSSLEFIQSSGWAALSTWGVGQASGVQSKCTVGGFYAITVLGTSWVVPVSFSLSPFFSLPDLPLWSLGSCHVICVLRESLLFTYMQTGFHFSTESNKTVRPQASARNLQPPASCGTVVIKPAEARDGVLSVPWRCPEVSFHATHVFNIQEPKSWGRKIYGPARVCVLCLRA